MRRHRHGVERVPDQIGQVVRFKSAALAGEMRVREYENLQLLRAFEHRAVPAATLSSIEIYFTVIE